jgi:type IV fimbrial biogenesis protein FimT
LSAVRKIRSDGFTLIELLITIAIFSITLTFGISSYRSWVLNSQIRNAAESISNGIMRARAEAVKCNARVAFVLGTASAWTVIHVDACGNLAAGNVLESRPASEGSKNVTVTVTPTGTHTVTFGSLGTAVPNTDNPPPPSTPSQFNLGSTVAVTGARPLWVQIGVGGDARVCDPDSAITAKNPPDPRRCY